MDDKGKEHARQVLFTLAGVLGRGGGGMLAVRQWNSIAQLPGSFAVFGPRAFRFYTQGTQGVQG